MPQRPAAIVTGSTSGIGLACAKALAGAAGALVVLWDGALFCYLPRGGKSITTLCSF